jgi:hypothetical protein
MYKTFNWDFFWRHVHLSEQNQKYVYDYAVSCVINFQEINIKTKDWRRIDIYNKYIYIYIFRWSTYLHSHFFRSDFFTIIVSTY